MSRRAILIEASKVKGQKEIPGARVDVANYSEFLQSPFGGGWNASEITILSHPTKSNLLAQIAAAKYDDYSFVTFSGHGYHIKGRDLDESRILINDTEEVSVETLNPGSSRSLIIADTCRNVTVLEEEVKQFSRALMEARAKLNPSKEGCRKLFDEVLAGTEKGAAFMYSCNLNESAGESSSRGGYFSRFQLDVGEQWGERQSQRASLTCFQSFSAASELTISKSKGQQHPQYECGRRTSHFPFAVFAYY